MTQDRAATIESYLKLFIEPGTITELRAFTDGGSFSGVFDYEHIHVMAAAAADMQTSRGVYFLPQPIAMPVTNRIGPARTCATDADVLKRHWILIDVDPTRPANVSATDTERAEAWRVLSSVQATMTASGWADPIVASSGNGWHLCYPVLLPNDDPTRDKIKSLLSGLDQRCSTAGAKVDTRTYNASRIWKLYGTHARKGGATAERPHRLAWVTTAAKQKDSSSTFGNNAALNTILAAWQHQDAALASLDRQRGSSQTDTVGRCKAYLAKVPPAISGQSGHSRAFHAAMIAVEGFGLSESDALVAMAEWNSRCAPEWSERELLHKIRDARKIGTNFGHLLVAAKPAQPTSTPRSRTVELYTGPERIATDVPDTDDEDPDATAADLLALQAEVQWTWPGWIQKGTITALASEPGVGKTRLCADLLRRVFLGLPWPDGTPANLPVGSRAIWIAADSQWSELGALPKEFDFLPEAIVLNSRRSNPYAGTNLDTVEDLANLERRIKRIQPAFVFVDTCGSATDRNTTRPEEAKLFFKPLAEIATRCNTSIILVTHLNKGGEALGRRIVGACRQVIKLDCPDPDGEPNRRKLWVDKTNAKKPVALGVTMSDHGNEYDETPPGSAPAMDEPGRNQQQRRPGRPSFIDSDKAWLLAHLQGQDGVSQVKPIIDAAEAIGISMDRLYRAMRSDPDTITESMINNRKYWTLQLEGDSGDR
jgi:hypothetical protein